MTTAELNLENLTQEIENWILNYLDVPSDHYSGHKPCPFARKAWVQNKCHVVIGDDRIIQQILHTWDDQYEIVAVAVAEDESEGLEEYCKAVNEELLEFKTDLVLLPFVASEEGPDDPDLEPEKWGSIISEAYSLVFVQRLSVVNRVSEVLEQMGYYDKVSPEFLKYVKERRG
tara:strand:+ start:1575 stop:2093 length:519 start_codon:yes stop_codon:yes gene_type:complete